MKIVFEFWADAHPMDADVQSEVARVVTMLDDGFSGGELRSDCEEKRGDWSVTEVEAWGVKS